MMKKHKVLFLCTGNSARSQMAEAFLRHYGGEYFEAYSAGREERGINPLTTRVMEEHGFDMSEARSKSVREYLGYQRFEYVIIVCRRADSNCPTVFPEASHYQRWIFDDPVKSEGTDEERLAVFRATRDRIEARVKLWIEETLEQVGTPTS